MANPKILVTAGCSFSQVNNSDITWPIPLKNYLNPERVFYLGQGAAGNGVISRKVIYQVSALLKKYNPEDILVGIMWSGRNRMDVYSTKEIPHERISNSEQSCNPVKIAQNYNLYILNNHWKDQSTSIFFKYFYDDAYASILTFEHILRVQWFLQSHKIKYFMTTYHPDSLPTTDHPYDREVMENLDVKHLYDMIDFDYWLPIKNMWQSATDSGIPFSRPPDPHPSTQQHQFFVDTVVIPWLKNKSFINID